MTQLKRIIRKAQKRASQAVLTQATRDKADATILSAISTTIKDINDPVERLIAQHQAYRVLQPFGVAEFAGIGTIGKPITVKQINAAQLKQDKVEQTTSTQ